MKNLKNILGLMVVSALAVVGMTNVYAADSQSTVCDNKTGSGNGTTVTCTLQDNDTMLAVSQDSVVTLKTNNHTLTISTAITIGKDATLVIDESAGGQVILSATGSLTLDEGAKVTIKNGTKVQSGSSYLAALDATGNGSTSIELKKNSTLEVSDNKGAGIIARSGLKIVLNKATLKINNNGKNALNGGVITATDSTIESNNNGASGIAASIILHDSTLTAKGNGYSGVSFNGGSVIDDGSVVTATENNIKGDPDDSVSKVADKADILINGDVTVSGKLVGGNMAPFKKNWTGQTGNVTTSASLVMQDGGTVSVTEVKTICAGTSVGGNCGDEGTTITPTSSSEGILVVGNKATIYGSVDDNYEFGSNIKEVTIDSSVSKSLTFTVAPGTSVVNNSSSAAVVTPKGGTVQSVSKNSTATVGIATTEPSDEPGAGDDNKPGTGDNEPSENPKTFDAIGSLITMAVSSLGVIGTATKKVLR